MSETRSIADLVFERRVKNVRPEWIADLFARLVWLLDDNDGDEICETLQHWLTTDDYERIEIALAFDEIFLYKTRSEMLYSFERITALYPNLKQRCEEKVKEWDVQFPNRND